MQPQSFRVLRLIPPSIGSGTNPGAIVASVKTFRVESGCLHSAESDEKAQLLSTSGKGYSRVAVAGTFDHLHEGHKQLLLGACYAADKDGVIEVGISDGPLLDRKECRTSLQSWEEREAAVIAFLRSIHPGDISTFRLMDEYGPILEDLSIECLVVSEETAGCMQNINNKRKVPVDFVIVPLVMGGDKKISSSDIRRKLE